MRIVVDTNVFVSGVFWAGKSGEIVDAWVRGRIELLTSPPIISEVIEVFRRFGMEEQKILEWQDALLENTVIVAPSFKLDYCRDPGDNMFLECAVAGKADYLVTGDNDLLSLGQVEGTKIITPAALVQLLD